LGTAGVFDIKSIQYLRGFAACAVLVFHLSESHGRFFTVGAAGVDVFFVISGFIMWMTTAGKEQTPQEFMSRRITRVVPLYWIVTAATALALALKPNLFFGHSLSLDNFVRSLFFVPEIQGDAFHPVVVQGWTLGFEMFFYLVFAACLAVSARYRAVVLIGALMAVVLARPLMGGAYVAAFADPIIVEFIGGVLVAIAWRSAIKVPLALSLAMFALGTVGFAIVDRVIPEAPRYLRWGAPALLVVAGAAFAERGRGVIEIPVLKLLGDASYSIYLWHVLIGVGFTAAAAHVAAPGPVEAIIEGLGALIVSVALYGLVERPLNALLHRRRRAAVPTVSPAFKGVGEA
jgi:exopolysaccharide production protein ExoZ